MPVLRHFNKKITHALDVVDTLGEMNIYKHIHNHAVDQLFPKVNYSTELNNDYACKTADSSEALLYLRKNEFYAHMQRVLRKVDLMSMSNSLEVRVPFLDAEVIQFCLQIIPQLGISHDIPKYLLKECLGTFIPKNLIDVKKRGFSVPIEKWMRHQLRNDITEYLLNKPIFGAELLQQEVLRDQVIGFFEHKKVNAWGIWHMYVWQKWAVQNNLI
jgi:asparagine synthase (glutamine-hydrolysing)